MQLRLSRPALLVRWALPGLVLLLVGSSTAGWAAAQRAVPTASCPQVIVPAYFNDEASWRRLERAEGVGIIVINPANGVGNRRSALIARQVKRVQAQGKTVLGYVKTGIGSRPQKAVRAEIKKYARWYSVDGIFLDEVHNLSRMIPYYRSLAAVIRREAGRGGDRGFVALNPGYVPAKGYFRFADLIQVYEYYYNRYSGQSFPDWIYDVPAHRIAHMILEAPNNEAALATALRLARQRNAGYVYVTNLQTPREFRALPSFWATHLSALCR